MVQENKKVDESWKDSVQKERSAAHSEPPRAVPSENEIPPPNIFMDFVSSLALQTLMALGDVPSEEGIEPPQSNLPQAQYLIDILQALSDKTKGNLSGEEEKAIKTLIYELKLKFVKKSQGMA